MGACAPRTRMFARLARACGAGCDPRPRMAARCRRGDPGVLRRSAARRRLLQLSAAPLIAAQCGAAYRSSVRLIAFDFGPVAARGFIAARGASQRHVAAVAACGGPFCGSSPPPFAAGQVKTYFARSWRASPVPYHEAAILADLTGPLRSAA